MQSDSSSSQLSTNDDIMDHIFREASPYHQILVKEMLQALENVVQASLIRSIDSSTPVLDYYSRYVDARVVKNEVERLFSLATNVDMETGMRNAFSDGLEEVIDKYGELALGNIQDLVIEEEIPFTIAAETLRYIGNIESGSYTEGRRKLLEACLLRSRFMLVRDGAAVGLSYIDDSRSIPALQRAIEQEPHTDLKNDLVEVLNLLLGASTE